MPVTAIVRNLLPARHWPTHTVCGGGGLRGVLFPDGQLRGIGADGTLISGLLGEPRGGGMFRLYLRRRLGDDKVVAHEVVAPGSGSVFGVDGNHAVWTGTLPASAAGEAALSYAVSLVPDPDAPRWGWRVDVTAPDGSDAAWDAVIVQDVGLAGEGTVRNNEKYVSQYLDHRIETHADHGPVVMSRQALSQFQGAHPWLLAACSPGATAAMTDGVTFFGTGHKADGRALHAETPTLPTGVVQHESGAAILQSRPQITSGGASSSVVFAFGFEPDHAAPSSPDDLNRVTPLLDAVGRVVEAAAVENPGPALHSAPAATKEPLLGAALRSGEPATDSDLEAWFGPRSTWRHVELKDDDFASISVGSGRTARVYSFFHGPDRHVATLGKDVALRRGHGHMLRTGKNWVPEDRALCVTCYQHGVFGSQATLGNTTFGALTGVARDPVNLNTAAGLRLAVDLDDGAGFVQLAESTAFEMAPGWCRWWYRFGARVLSVRAVASPDAALLRYELRVHAGPPVRVKLSQHFSLGERGDGYATTLHIDPDAGRVAATPDTESELAKTFPAARCVLAFDDAAILQRLDAEPIDPADPEAGCWPYLCVETAAVETLRWSFTASPDAAGLPDDLTPDVDDTVAAADAYWADLYAPMFERFDGVEHGSRVADGLPDDLSRLRDIVPWFVHNAMIHLSVPHGLEQFGGAAWGTRDVCQGSVELLLAIQRPDVIADILRVVFRHQHRQTGDWPQWFMQAPFQNIQAGDSHGDVVVWPLYALCHYLEATGDAALLDEPVGYTEADRTAERAGFPFSDSTHDASVKRHAQHAIERIVSQRIPGTALPRYGHGDWNDSLQPAEPWMADRMVSSWTVALLQHTLSRLAAAVAASDPAWADELAQHAAAVAADFQKWCVVPTPSGEDQVAGIILFDADFRGAEPLLHPADKRTGIHHSLIPMNRGLLAGLFDAEQAAHHWGVIENHLLAPDGVRLMERPPRYTGGESRFFQRAESAAFFGREIGLMYVHAHLRYAEALLTAGRTQDAIAALNLVNPVALPEHVANAAPRQANAYFSSSDARFDTRYQADAEHHRVFEGSATVDGGWRIYSSGPGIFLHLLRRALAQSGPA